MVNGNDVNYFYSSQNFLAFDTSVTIHNQHSMSSFIQRLRSFSLRNYIINAERDLGLKYDDIILTPISIHFYIRRRPDIVYGKDKT